MKSRHKRLHLCMRFSCVCLVCALCFGQSLSAHAQQAPTPKELMSSTCACEDEPGLSQVQLKALVHHKLQGALDQWSFRARLSNLLPRVELRAGLDQNHDEGMNYREDQILDESGHMRRDFARQQSDREHSTSTQYAIRLTFTPSGLIFDPREISIQRHVLDLKRKRRELLKEIATVYVARRKSQIMLAILPTSDVKTRALLKIDVELHTATLDAYTNGWFTHTLTARAAAKAKKNVTRRSTP